MTDTDRMGELQAAAHALRVLAETTPPQEQPSIAEQVENIRSLRTLTEALTKLVSDAASHAMVEERNPAGYATRIMNPHRTAGQHALHARTVLYAAAGSLRDVVQVSLQVADMSLARITPPEPEPEEAPND